MDALPLVVVYVLGLVMALLQMQRLPRVAAAAGGGFGGLLLVMLIQPAINKLIYLALGSDGRAISLMLTLFGFVFNLLAAVATGAIAYAVFVDRPEVHLPLPLPGQKPPGPQPGNLGR